MEFKGYKVKTGGDLFTQTLKEFTVVLSGGWTGSNDKSGVLGEGEGIGDSLECCLKEVEVAQTEGFEDASGGLVKGRFVVIFDSHSDASNALEAVEYVSKSSHRLLDSTILDFTKVSVEVPDLSYNVASMCTCFDI